MIPFAPCNLPFAPSLFSVRFPHNSFLPCSFSFPFLPLFSSSLPSLSPSSPSRLSPYLSPVFSVSLSVYSFLSCPLRFRFCIQRSTPAVYAPLLTSLPKLSPPFVAHVSPLVSPFDQVNVPPSPVPVTPLESFCWHASRRLDTYCPSASLLQDHRPHASSNPPASLSLLKFSNVHLKSNS
jgi:hypothetical protein